MDKPIYINHTCKRKHRAPSTEHRTASLPARGDVYCLVSVAVPLAEIMSFCKHSGLGSQGATAF